METTTDSPPATLPALDATGACACCPHTLTNPEDLPPEVVAGYHQHQLACRCYRQTLAAQGARFREERCSGASRVGRDAAVLCGNVKRSVLNTVHGVGYMLKAEG